MCLHFCAAGFFLVFLHSVSCVWTYKNVTKGFFNNYNVLPKKSIPKNMCCFSPPQIGSCCSKLIVKIMLYISKIDYWYIKNWLKTVLNQIFRAYSETRTIKSTIFKIPVYIHNWLKIWKRCNCFWLPFKINIRDFICPCVTYSWLRPKCKWSSW
jgi:hypothetical protein